MTEFDLWTMNRKNGMGGQENTLPMIMSKGCFGNLEMGGMFTLVKVRDQLQGDLGWHRVQREHRRRK